eukprot:Opistho-1_new@92996
MLDQTLPHVLPLQGGSNFRDLGGYRTADGRLVRRGAVFRSAHLGGLTDEDRTALGTIGVRTIVDLRMLDQTLPHVLPLQGGSNFRDLGGYRTADGRLVRRGAVFRSAHLGGLTDEDRTALGTIGVRTIVDLRMLDQTLP